MARGRQDTELKQFLKEWRSIYGAGAAIATLMPLGAEVKESVPMRPQWPENAGIIAAGLSAVTIVFLFLFCRAAAISRRLISGLFVTALCCFFVYLAANAKYVEEDAIDEPVITGLCHTREATEAMHTKGGPSDDARDLLDYFGHESEDRIWDYRWVVKFFLAAVFIAGFVSAASAFDLMIIQRYNERQSTSAEADQ